jgi:hypothetical protein
VCCMAKAKKTKPRDRLVRWRVSLIRGHAGEVHRLRPCPDAATAEKQVAEEHDIREDLRDRLVAIREEL